ncbi:hypothetical protein Lal_00037594 [Lupinus albus]|nr:hypothetical protein Lal_00037594 [Lupinus albus]
MNRYHTICEDDNNTNVEKDKENLLPVFESQTFTDNLPNDNNENDDDDDDYSMKGIDIEYSSEDEEQFDNSSFIEITANGEGYFDTSDPVIECEHCGACMWYQERKRKHRNTTSPKYELCCGDGRIQLPLLKSPPPTLQHLLFDLKSNDSVNNQNNIRLYNMMFAFTSLGAKIDRSVNNGRGPPTIRIQGQPCHHIGSMLPMPGQLPKFAQLYIYDTEHEIQNRMNGIRDNNVDLQVVMKLTKILDDNNVHAKSFRMASERLRHDGVTNLKWKNKSQVSEVAALIVGDIDSTSQRDIIMETQSGQLKRINELHASYLDFQYLLLFLYGEDGYRHDVCHRDRLSSQGRKRNRVTIVLYQEKPKKLRVDKYKNLNDTQGIDQSQGSNQGKRVILPSTFVGGRRYMDQLYFDGMAICSSLGFPDLFLTMTGNPNWPEIVRILKPMGLKPHDHPNIISMFFKMKFEELLHDLKKIHVLGKMDIHFIEEEIMETLLTKMYINKGYDRVTAVIESTEDGVTLNERPIDEVKQYLDCRYISPSEASWRIFGFPIHGRQPTVERLYFHLPGEHPVYFNDNDEIDNILSRPTVSESMEYIEALKEAYAWGSGFYLRKLFVTMLISTSMNKPNHVWEESWKWLCDGILYNQRNIAKNQGLMLSDEELKNLTLVEIEKLLQRNRRSLRDYPPMPYPKGYITRQLGNKLIYDELNYDTNELKDKFNLLFQSLTDEQCKIQNYHGSCKPRTWTHVFLIWLWRNWKNPYVENSDICIKI